MEEYSNPSSTIQQLVERWCERRALNPLRTLLPCYPLHTPQTDGWLDLYRALKDVKVFCKGDLLPEEQAMLQSAMVGIADALDRSAGTGGWYA